MIYYNAEIFTQERGFVHGGFAVENGRFAEVFSGERGGDVDLGGALVIPGLVDLHIHGAAGADFSDGDAEGLRRMARYLASRGVTSFAPTGMTLPYETIGAAIDTARQLREAPPADGARCAGVHMEGPFFSEKKKGAQNAGFGGAGWRDFKRRTRSWSTPHAKFAIAARGIDRRRQPKITQKPAKTAHFAKQRCQFRTIRPQINSFNNLIITGNSI